jgi:type IV pilus assembly protein PilV
MTLLNGRRRVRIGGGSRKAEQGGMAILEALVAMLVFAFGILGVVGLQGSMTREQTASKFRTDAGYLASELVGTMWSDLSNLSSYDSGSCAGYTRCDDWANKVAKALPGGTATVTVTATTTSYSTDNDVSIVITWTMPSGDIHQFEMATTIVANAS